MTVDICWKCGEMKFGAFTPCPQCGAMPETEDDLATSLAMTDHYFDEPTLRLLGAKAKEGVQVQLAPEMKDNFLKMIRETGAMGMMQRLIAGAGSVEEAMGMPAAVKKPWWKKLFGR